MNRTFEDSLWNALKQEAERPEHELPADRFRARPARRSVTAGRLGLGLAATAAIGTVLALVPGSGSATAYAVETQKDGAVKITVQEASKATLGRDQVEALESELRDAGINVIEDASTPYSCHSSSNARDGFRLTPSRPGPRPAGVMFRSDSPHAQVAVLRPGDTAWIESGRSSEGPTAYSITLLPAICAPAHGGR